MRRLWAGCLTVTIVVSMSLSGATPAAADADALNLWQGQLCSFAGGFGPTITRITEALPDISRPTPGEDPRITVRRYAAEVNKEARRLLRSQPTELGPLPMPKPKRITKPLRRRLDSTLTMYSAIERAGAKLPDSSSEDWAPALVALQDRLDRAFASYEDAMYWLYGHTGVSAFDEAIVTNRTCGLLSSYRDVIDS